MSDSTRPPNQPPTPPPPPRPKPPAPPPPLADRMSAAVADIRARVARIESPARQGSNRVSSGLGGPVRPSDDSGGVRAGSPPAPGAGDSFTLPARVGPPEFAVGTAVLRGGVR